ncbi:uncharacterized protein Pyn_25833 [Prunus yedoensis var. nudiflora]|uniref:Neprosin activation peptide domain-containing protein n=1 Tax=Prunus yedoensis var. nudiflora TaxID=2094558 RepID=A0A314YF86_PRUYE|nr:uncharacterized protein Pyn_25833 [Prunus yedoensis var. nudiflora]
MSTTREEDLELETQLRSLNKPPLEEGDIIDCFDIYTQPAFDNPLLKNHKIQLRPTSFPAQMKNSAPVTDPIFETWSKREACPDGTVPIHRTTKNDLVRAKNLAHKMFRNTRNTNPLPWNIHVSPSINGDQLPRLYTYWTDTQNIKLVACCNRQEHYWPKEMLPHLRNGAGEVGWGGTAMAATKRSPPIGSGQYQYENYDRATYFRECC